MELMTVISIVPVAPHSTTVVAVAVAVRDADDHQFAAGVRLDPVRLDARHAEQLARIGFGQLIVRRQAGDDSDDGSTRALPVAVELLRPRRVTRTHPRRDVVRRTIETAGVGQRLDQRPEPDHRALPVQEVGIVGRQFRLLVQRAECFVRRRGGRRARRHR
jgi:hypothetical protein